MPATTVFLICPLSLSSAAAAAAAAAVSSFFWRWWFVVLVVTVSISNCEAQQPIPTNNCGAEAVTAVPPFQDVFNTTAAANITDGVLGLDDNNRCGVPTSQHVHGVWFEYNGNDKIVKIRISGATFSNRLTAFVVTGDDDCSLSCLFSDDAGYLSWPALSSETYRLLVSGGTSGGTGTIDITEIDRPPNDNCDTAIEIPSIRPFSLSGDSSGAFSDFSTTTCSVSPESRGIWYTISAPSEANKTLRLHVKDATFNNRMAVFTTAAAPGTTSCESMTCLDTNDGRGDTSFLSWFVSNDDVIANMEYKVLVTGVGGFKHVGTFTLSVEEFNPPPNGSCENAIEFPRLPLALLGDTSGAYTDFSSSICKVGTASHGLWYKLTPTTDDKVLRLRLVGAKFNNRLAVFTGTCDSLSCFAENDGDGDSSFLSWIGTANTEYRVFVTGARGNIDIGNFNLSAAEFDRPLNDSCETATLVAETSFWELSDTSGAFADFNLNICSVNADAKGIWYTFIGEDGTVEMTIANVVFNVELFAFSGECALLTCVDSNDGNGNSASLSLSTVAGTKYSILVTGVKVKGFADVGTFEITIEGDISTTVASDLARIPTPAPQLASLPTSAPASILDVTSIPSSTNAPASAPTTQGTTVSTLRVEENKALNIPPPSRTVSVDVAAYPPNGSIAVDASNSVTYRPDNDFVGVDVFSVKYCDTSDKCTTTDFTVTVFASKAPSGTSKALYGLATLAIIPLIVLFVLWKRNRSWCSDKRDATRESTQESDPPRLFEEPTAVGRSRPSAQPRNTGQARTHVLDPAEPVVTRPPMYHLRNKDQCLTVVLPGEDAVVPIAPAVKVPAAKLDP